MLAGDFKIEKFQIDLSNMEFIEVSADDWISQSFEGDRRNIFHLLLYFIVLSRVISNFDDVVFPSVDFEIDLKILANDNVTNFENIDFTLL